MLPCSQGSTQQQNVMYCLWVFNKTIQLLDCNERQDIPKAVVHMKSNDSDPDQ